jgi:alpha-mannosidase
LTVLVRLCFHAQVAPGKLCVLRLVRRPVAAVTQRLQLTGTSTVNDQGFGVQFGDQPGLLLGDKQRLPLPRLDLLNDHTDNWSHGVDRFAEGPVQSPVWSAATLYDRGPLMASWLRQSRLDDSIVREEWRVYHDLAMVELRLRVHWRQGRQLLKLVLPLADGGEERLDGIAGGHLARPNSGRECPLQDWTRLTLPTGQFAVVSPDLFAVDATPERLRFTLLRSPILTQHDPFPYDASRAVFADQGEHEFRLRFLAGPDLSPTRLTDEALMMHRPLLAADLTRGMPRGGELQA